MSRRDVVSLGLLERHWRTKARLQCGHVWKHTLVGRSLGRQLHVPTTKPMSSMSRGSVGLLYIPL